MQIQLKRLGKKKVHLVEVTLAHTPHTLKELITECVRSEVERFNESWEETSLLPFLSPQEIGEQAQGGKITFGEKENRTLADLDTALDTALLAFTDGLFTVFINDEEVKSLDAPLTIEADTVITFIRLTFLVGGYW